MLTGRQQLFIAAYLGPANFNASEAARLAGYKEAALAGHRLLRNDKISALVREAIREKAMPPEEIIARLSDIGRGSLDDFVDIDDDTGNVSLNLSKAKRRGLMHTFETVEYSDKGRLKIKRYDALEALEKLARIHKMFSDGRATFDIRVLNLIIDALPEECRERVLRALEEGLELGEDSDLNISCP
jgi:phage terminase small subunit